MKSLSLALLLLPASAAFAAQTNGGFTATVSVPGNCSITTTQNIQFGIFDPMGAHASVGPSGQGQVQIWPWLHLHSL